MTTMTQTESQTGQNWLEELKEGDRVIVSSTSQLAGKTLATVKKVTAKQIVTDDDRRYWKKDGACVGSSDSLFQSRLLKVDPESIAAVEAEMLRRQLYSKFGLMRERHWERFTLSQLKQLKAIFDEAENHAKTIAH